MREQTFGIEIEFTGMTRYDAAKVVAGYFGTTERYAGITYGVTGYEIPDQAGRIWKVCYDGSITAGRKDGGYAGDEYKVELVSPICRYGDIETVQEIVRLLRKKGMIANDSCGIHVHIGKDGHTARSLKNIINIMKSKEDLLFKALKVKENRESYCKKTDDAVVARVNRTSKPTDASVQRAWYGAATNSYSQRDTRYHALNLHAVWTKGTVEFRCFNSTTHAGEIKSYIQLALAISHQAKTQKCASARKTKSTNEKFTFRTWLIRLGLNGDEFKTAREHLLKHLEGDIAWKDNRRTAV